MTLLNRIQRPRNIIQSLIIVLFSIILVPSCRQQLKPERVRWETEFNRNWKFHLGDVESAQDPKFDDAGWRVLSLPHDWSIEGKFSPDNPATPGGGALPGGVGWYRKHFTLPDEQNGKLVFIDFDGVYMNSDVWINGFHLGNRPNGYISFRYELTPYLRKGSLDNVIAVRVDNSKQPNSRWYSGSGIYRNVHLVAVNPVHVDHWGTCITTPEVSEQSAAIEIKTTVRNSSDGDQKISCETVIYDGSNHVISRSVSDSLVPAESSVVMMRHCRVVNPELWSLDQPHLYFAMTRIADGDKMLDDYETVFGIRTFHFDPDSGFFLNGKPVKIRGVCDHHDLGCLGAAVHRRALERQIEILKDMGANSIRTSHNPPAPELLDLCDRMGILVMDEMFDMWKKKKTPYDFALYWDDWHQRDLTDFIMRDRNHPSVIIWSIGNEILEQWDPSGTPIAKELAGIVRSLDTTRPITSACNDPRPDNFIIRSKELDLIGYNYHQQDFESFHETFPGQVFIATETNSGLATRGCYDMPSDSIRRWPIRWDIPFTSGNPDNTCSAYDNCSAPWGSTQEETWKIVRKHAFLSGVYIWTGFDYLGEPTPYGWPSRSSYFGLVDLAGFPKDTYYFYKGEWTDEPMLHVFPHWNWQENETVDVWAYTNCEEAELFLDGVSMGTRKKTDDTLHMMWRLNFEPGTLKVIGLKNGKTIIAREVHTAGVPERLTLEADRKKIKADSRDLSFVTVTVRDKRGVMVPYADNLVHFNLTGEGTLIGVDNGLQTSHEPFRANYRKAFNGLCLAVIQSTDRSGKIVLKASADGLTGDEITIQSK